MASNPNTEGTKAEIVNRLHVSGEPGSRAHEQTKMAIFVRCTEDIENSIKNLEKTIDENSASSHNLARKVFWLNCAVGLATIVGAIIGIINIIYKCH